MFRVHIGVLATLGLLAAAPAEAQQWPPQPSGDTKHVLFGELGIGHTSGQDQFFGTTVDTSATVFSPIVGGRFTLVEPVELGFLWGFANGSYSYDGPLGGSTDGSAFVIGNLQIEGSYGFDFDGIALRVGAGLTLPLASVSDDIGSDPDSFAELVAYIGAMGMRGGWNAWLWDPNRLTLIPAIVRVDSNPEETFYWAGEAALGLMVDLDDDDATGDRDTETIFQLAGEAGGRFSRQFIVGGRLQIVAGSTPDADDDAQISMAPFFRWEAEHGFFVARFLLNLDDPFGFSFDDGKIWGLHLGGGGRF